MSESLGTKKQLVEELKKDNPDWRLIERLSRDEVDSDPNDVRFSVDAGHVQRLGFELVAKQETALAELIKNSFDADASAVNIVFKGQDIKGGTLTITDNGTGMGAGVVRNAWMRISTTSKHDERRSTRYGRVRAGRKGIGRFAVQRLGKHLILETEARGEANGLRVKFDWDGEFLPGRHLQDVFNSIEEYEKPVEREGTTLKIIDLREKWTDAAMKRAWKAVLLLQPPFKLSREPSSEEYEYLSDPGFEVTIDGLTTTQHKTELSIDNNFLDHAIAEITGEVSADGSAYVRVHSTKLGLDERQDFEESFLLTGPLFFSTKYFIYKSDTLSGLSMSLAHKMADEFGGVRIYRNSFRVLPYGEPADDWLRLDRDVGRRHLLIPAHNKSFFGQVELDEKENLLFEETSSREGFIENDAFEELRSFVRDGVEWAVKRIAAIRDRKETAGQKDFVSKVRPRIKPSDIIGSITERLEAAKADSQEGPSLAGEDEEVDYDDISTRKIIEEAAEEAKAWELENELRHEAALRYEEMLRILASLGLSVTIFGHEIKGVRNLVASQLVLLNEDVDLITDEKAKATCAETVSDLHSSTGRMFDLGGYIAGLMSNTESRDLVQISVKGAVDRFVGQFAQYMKRQHIVFDVDINPAHLRTTNMHISELDSVLLNFMTNSIKSMKKARVSKRNIKITARNDDPYILLRFEDNGSGVTPEIEDKIFDAFFTTTIGTGNDEVAGPGAGLGLRIVSDIAKCYGGSVRLGAPTEGYNCCFEFRVLSANTKGNE